MDIISKNTTIFVKDIDGKKHYRAGLSNKQTDGSYQSAYIDVRMPKGTNIENKTKINITKGFLTFYKTKEGKDIWYVVVQEFTTEQQMKDTEVYVVHDVKAENLELPF